MTRPRVLVAVIVLSVACVGGIVVAGRGPSESFTQMDRVGRRAVEAIRRGAPTWATVEWRGRSYPLTRGDRPDAVAFGGISPSCDHDPTLLVYSDSGRPSQVWPTARRMSEHWFVTEECIGGGEI